MLEWLQRKSGEHQLRNAERSLGRLIAAANVLNDAWAANREETPEELQAFKNAKSGFCMDLLGPIPLPDIRRQLIEPALANPRVSEGARAAVTHAYEYVAKQSGSEVAPPAAAPAELSFEQYLKQEDSALAAWGGKECLRLELLMDYSGPFREPTAIPPVLGNAAIRWSVLSDDFGNRLHASWPEALQLTQAIVIAFLYAKILTLDRTHRTELFRRVEEAVELCSLSDYWSALDFNPWHLEGSETVWPWTITAWDSIEANRSLAFVELAPGHMLGTMKTYTATLLTGPVAPLAPQGWWLRFQQSDPQLGAVLLPAAPLIAFTSFLNDAPDNNELAFLLQRVNSYYESPERVFPGTEALAIRAALQSGAKPDDGAVADYRRRDDAMLHNGQAE